MVSDTGRIGRVAFVAPEMEARGTSEYVVYLAAELRRRGVAVTVFCAPGPMRSVLEEKDVPAETFERLGRLGFRRGEQDRLADRIAACRPQLAHAQTVRAAALLTRLARRLLVPVVLTVHAAPRRRRAFRLLAAHLAGIIATTQDVREELVNNLRVKKSSIAVIPNGIDVEAVERRKIRAAFKGGTMVIGSVGPVEERRGHEMFVRAAARIAAAHPSVQFVVAGEGENLPKVRQLAQALGLSERMTFVGDFSSYAEVLGALDVMVQSSQVDVSGFSILDAMGHGRPVIAFNTGTACEIVEDGKTGVLVPLEEVDALADAMRRMIEDPDRARRMGEAARNAAQQRFNIKEVAEQTLAFYASRLAR